MILIISINRITDNTAIKPVIGILSQIYLGFLIFDGGDGMAIAP